MGTDPEGISYTEAQRKTEGEGEFDGDFGIKRIWVGMGGDLSAVRSGVVGNRATTSGDKSEEAVAIDVSCRKLYFDTLSTSPRYSGTGEPSGQAFSNLL